MKTFYLSALSERDMFCYSKMRYLRTDPAVLMPDLGENRGLFLKSLMSYFSLKKEKAAIVVLLLLILLTGWYVGIYSPIQERIEAADTTDLEDAIAMEQVSSARIKLCRLRSRKISMQMFGG